MTAFLDVVGTCRVAVTVAATATVIAGPQSGCGCDSGVAVSCDLDVDCVFLGGDDVSRLNFDSGDVSDDSGESSTSDSVADS